MVSAATFKGPVGPLRHRCAHCNTTDASTKLLRCSGCLAVRYCSRAHQVAHRGEHKKICTKIRKARAKLAEEDDLVRNNPLANFMDPPNAFETHVGHFWGLVSTRDYMRARYALAVSLLLREVGPPTLDAVTEAHDHLMDMMRLSRRDGMGLRDVVPAVMLRLDRDQECYDFIKWWATTCDPHGTYDWGDMSRPHLDLRGEDVFEDQGWLNALSFQAPHQLVAILLLKLKILIDIRNIKVVRKVLAYCKPPLPAELWQPIELAAVRSPLSVKLQKQDTESLRKTELTLLGHAHELIAAVVKSSRAFMVTLFDPDEALVARPDAYSPGSWEEMAVAMVICYPAFWEAQGVLDLLNEARAVAARYSEREVDERLAEDDDGSYAQGRTRDEVLADISVKRIWAYLGHAVENASYLGPWDERPSERYTREVREAWARGIVEMEEEEAALRDGLWDD